MNRTLALLTEGGTGHLPTHKRNGYIRIMFENWNSLGIFTHSWKIERINYLIKRHQIDIVAGCESQCNWALVPRHRHLADIISPGYMKQGIAAHNQHENFHRDQVGGTAVMGVGRICDLISEKGYDPTGLGRWSWVKLGKGNVTTRVVSAYLPRKPNKHSKGRTVWDQHARYFQKQGDLRYPTTIFMEDFMSQIKQWSAQGNHILIAIDANQDIYSGRLAIALRQDPLNIQCLMERATGEKVPNSHFRGTGNISTIFGSPGLAHGHGCCFPHWYGVGDHRVMILELTAKSLYNGDYPTIASSGARLLNCRIRRTTKTYCKRLNDLIRRHHLHDRLTALQHPSNYSKTKSVQYHHNKWDTEFGEYMRSAERVCTKYKDNYIEYSPTVGQWLKRRAILRWLLRWHDGKVTNIRNLLRAARRNNIDDPLNLTRTEVEQRLEACLNLLYNLRNQAPSLRQKHLQWRFTVAKRRDDISAQTEINRIMKQEAKRKRQRHINHQIKVPRGRAILQVKIDTPQGTITHANREDVETACKEGLSERFNLGQRAPINFGALAQDFGQLGNSHASHLLFKGEYNFPADCDSATKDLLQGIAHIKRQFQSMDPIADTVTPDDYISFWKSAKEDTASSKSGRHFGHYKAICGDPTLVELHTNNINLAAQYGNPLKRWQSGVTVLLEKIPGNTNLAKLRAICLLEADYNWWLKVIFAKRMISRMHSHGIMPLEQGATRGKTTMDMALLKQLFFDQANILHENCSISSTDAETCYDAVNHTISSLCLQAMCVSMFLIQCYLVCIQTMQYYLQTGFGQADTGYGGTTSHRSMGLVQGSGAAPATWTAVSTAIVDTYKRKGYGASLYAGHNDSSLNVAALLYVDDTDLIHKPQKPQATEEEIVDYTQRATYYWTKLLQATGGNLKATKCYWYLLSYKFNKGIATLKSLNELPRYTLHIPQPEGKDIAIELKDNHTATQVLGVWSSPGSTDSQHLQYMVDKGQEWIRRIQKSTLDTQEVWQSFLTQAIPSVRYGLLTLMSHRQEIDDLFHSWYYQCLPSLGITRSITKAWRTLPTEFQGLGLPNMSLEKLATSLTFLQHHWNNHTAIGRALIGTYELCQLEIGLSNFLEKNYKRFRVLASNSWFKVLWELLDYYKVTLTLIDTSIPPPRQRDQVLMERITDTLPQHYWAAFNRVRHFYKVYFMSQITRCDGKTINPAFMTSRTIKASSMRFPIEQPTEGDFEIWTLGLKSLTSHTFQLPIPLGHFIKDPYQDTLWRTTANNDYVIKSLGRNHHNIYRPCPSVYHTRNHNTYRYHKTCHQTPPWTHYASVSQLTPTMISLHSQARIDTPSDTKPTSFLQFLQKHDSAHFFDHNPFNKDIEWITTAIVQKSLTIAHDGSYMPNLSRKTCSAAVVILCNKTGNLGAFTVCEKSDEYTASNYRGELLGGLIATHLLVMAAKYTNINPKGIQIYCDNMGVVHHGNNPHKSLPEKQPQADILLPFRHNLRSLTNGIQYRHVFGHSDSETEFSFLTIPEQLNIIADKLAQECLLARTHTGPYSQTTYPNEPLQIYIDKRKVTSSIKATLYTSWGRQQAKVHFHNRKIIKEEHFNLVFWDGLKGTLQTYSKPLQLWITKHVSHFCGTNRQLSKMDTTIKNICMCCKKSNEDTAHITRCRNTGRALMFHQTTEELLNWMKNTQGNVLLMDALDIYLKYRGRHSMRAIVRPHPELHKFGHHHDKLGWDNFMEGRICTQFFQLQAQTLTQNSSKWTIRAWSSQFIKRVLNITHRQWLYRNARIHIKLVDGLTEPEHQQIIHLVHNLLNTDPNDLLPQHRHLLQKDFQQLGEGSALDRQYWIADMQSALQTANIVLRRKGRKRRASSTGEALTQNVQIRQQAKRLRM